ncbi:MAG: hypothetical protein IPJ81_08590 [Chitinophagaceae bacterium]|nr:hypothetical protein [Chitinophagaceae bacterium]
MMVLTAMVSCQLHTPISVMCLSQSGVGKSYTVHKCAACIPKEWQRKGTSFTEQSFYHFLEDELSHTVFIIEDTTGLKGVEYVTRELMSGEEVVKFMPEKRQPQRKDQYGTHYRKRPHQLYRNHHQRQTIRRQQQPDDRNLFRRQRPAGCRNSRIPKKSKSRVD